MEHSESRRCRIAKSSILRQASPPPAKLATRNVPDCPKDILVHDVYNRLLKVTRMSNFSTEAYDWSWFYSSRRSDQHFPDCSRSARKPDDGNSDTTIVAPTAPLAAMARWRSYQVKGMRFAFLLISLLGSAVRLPGKEIQSPVPVASELTPTVDPIFPPPPAVETLLQATPQISPLDQVPPHHQDTSSIASRYGVIPALLAGENVLGPISPPRFPGVSAGQLPAWGTPNVTVADPRKYPHITSLDVDDPDSFFDWMRPNLFGEPVEDEWDWLNMINTERPDFTDITYGVGKGVTYLENGFTYTSIRDGGQKTSVTSLPETMLRYGLTDEIEIRFKWNGLIGLDQTTLPANQRYSNFGQQDADVSIKFELLQQQNWLPMTVLNTGIVLPTGTNQFSGNSAQPHFNIINGWGIRRWAYLKHQFGMDYLTQPGFSPNSSVMPNTDFTLNQVIIDRPVVHSYHSSISLLYHMTRHWGGFHEWYCLYGPDFATTNYWDEGLFYYLTPNIQLDAVVGTELSHSQDYKFCRGGISFRW